MSPKKSRFSRLCRAVRAMLKRGWLDVYRRESRQSAYIRLETPDREAALDSDEYWRADDQETVEIGVAATKSGEAAYQTADFEPIRRAILSLLLDDAFLLCHVAGALPYDGYPNLSAEQLLETARKETLTMASAGLIEVLECLDPETQRKYSPIDQSRQGEILLNPGNWAIPSAKSASTFWIELTPAGEQALRIISGQELGG